MSTIKVLFVQGNAMVNNERVEVYAVQMPDGTFKHEQRVDQISADAYQKLILKNYPNYKFIVEEEEEDEEEIVLMTPKVEEATHPYKEELDKAFSMDEVEFKQPPAAPNLDQDTGEILEDPIVEPLKQEEPMETQSEAPKQEEHKKKVSLARKAKWYGACGVGLGVRTLTVPTHVTLQTASDVLHLMAVGVRNTEAFAIDKLKLSTATRDEIKGRIDQRTQRIQSVLMMPVTIPVGIVQSARMAMKPVEPQPQTA